LSPFPGTLYELRKGRISIRRKNSRAFFIKIGFEGTKITIYGEKFLAGERGSGGQGSMKVGNIIL
jgi:hypothetical protein